jgi:hypothetical protein
MVGYQLGMHNWLILTEEGCVELSHDVGFDKAQYPGISTSCPAGFVLPPEAEVLAKEFDDINQSSVPLVDEDTENQNENIDKSNNSLDSSSSSGDLEYQLVVW